jgi:TonB family protein
MLSLAAHGLSVGAWVLSVYISSVPAPGVANASPEIAMLQRAPAQYLPSVLRQIPQTEVPPVPLLPVDPVETTLLKEFEEPALDEAELLDPLLEEDSFEDLALDSLSMDENEEEQEQEVELEEEEPVGEIPETLRSLLESPEVSYPRAAYLRKLEGTVVLSMVVNFDGSVTEVEVIQSSGHRLLDRAALVAARSYRFESGEGNMTVQKSFTFRLP